MIGIFDFGNKGINERNVYVALRTAQNLLDLAGGVSTLETRVRDICSPRRMIAIGINRRTGLDGIWESWMTRNRAGLLAGLRSQNNSSYIVIQFFVVVAVALGIASVLVVSVVQKEGDRDPAGDGHDEEADPAHLSHPGHAAWVSPGLGAGSRPGRPALSYFSFAGMATNPDGSPTSSASTSHPCSSSARLAMALDGRRHLSRRVVPARRAAGLDPAQVIHHG